MATLTDRLTEAVIADAAEEYRRERMREAIREHIEAAMQDSTFNDERADDLAQIGAAHAATEVGTEEDRGDPLAVFVGMRNALLMTAGVALIVCGIAVLIVGWP